MNDNSFNIASNCDALRDFTQRYQNAWLNTYNHLPKSLELYGFVSPCIVDTLDLAVLWQAVEAQHSLAIVEEVIGINIHPSAHDFYGSQYAGDMAANWQGRTINLVQVWSEEDFSRLEQNLIAHLSMQKKLKRHPTIFIAATDDNSEIIAIDNVTGEIVLEKLIDNQKDFLAPNLVAFLSALTPIAQ